MSPKSIAFNADARQRMIKGVNVLTDAVAVTLGPRGRNVMIEKSFGAPRTTKDGVTVAKSIELADPYANIGVRLIREAAERTAKLAGDGTTTSTVLARSILREGNKAVVAGMNAMDVKRGIDAAVRALVVELASLSRPVESSDQIRQVATIASNGDEEVGRIISDALDRVGREGAITVEEAKSREMVLEVVDGMQFDRGYLSPYFVTASDKMTVELDDAFILLHERKLSNMRPLVPILEAVIEADRPILVIAEDVDGEALASLVVNRLRGNLRCAAVKAPGFGDRRKAMLQDIAALTGATVVSEDLGTKLVNVTLDMLGRAKRILITKDDTTIIYGAGTPEDIEARCASIKTQIEDTTSDYDREKLEERLAKLSGGVAVIHVGGVTEVEVKERKDRVDDALHATRAAVAEGILPGGGTALLRASHAMNPEGLINDDMRAGATIVRRAATEPVRLIARNAGKDGAYIVDQLTRKNDTVWGYDAQTDQFVDMFEAGIVDPTKVVRIALQDAASIAGLMMTTEAVVVEKPKPRRQDVPMPDYVDDLAGMDF
ncbi:chaperonin GroEL [Roseovarius rhodophyticola]|uniref:Chaperonin GroEL n=1 Tax=Roseovarius rhodophyticola TaxID=3080827 RepID=A0ABZ2TGF7_9RHOB|nr:chaperonin GroEL [Roseovarius sp. W115]MDV2928424.1 chaperonin GroEL [Roseovarius sp. W115]